MLNTIIIEDEKAARQNLINALMNIDANLNVAAELSSVRESIEYFSRHRKQILSFAMCNWRTGYHLKFSVRSRSALR